MSLGCDVENLILKSEATFATISRSCAKLVVGILASSTSPFLLIFQGNYF